MHARQPDQRPVGRPSSGRSRRACSARRSTTRRSRTSSTRSSGTTRSRRWTTTTAWCRRSVRTTRAATATATARPRAGSRSFPDNTMTVVSFMGLYKFARHTTVNGTVQISDQSQNDDLIPWTTNARDQPADRVGVVPRPRGAAADDGRGEGARRQRAAELHVAADEQGRASPRSTATTRTRTSRRPFDARRVRAVRRGAGGDRRRRPKATTSSATRSTRRCRSTVMPFSTLRVGYGYDNFDRTGRAHNDMRDQAFRADAGTRTGNQYVTLRVGYEHVARTGFGFSEMAIEEGGAQPGPAVLRRGRPRPRPRQHPRDADAGRERRRHGVGGVRQGRLRRPGPRVRPARQQEHGVQRRRRTSRRAPTVAFGANYGRDNFSSFQKSRNANPPPDPTVDRSEPRLDAGQRREGEQLRPVPRPDARRIKNTDIRFALQLQRLGQRASCYGGPRIRDARSRRRPAPGIRRSKRCRT